MLALSTIKFGVDTSELDAVKVKIATVIKAVEGLSNAQTKAQVNNSKASKAAADAQKKEAEAALAQLKLEEKKAQAVQKTSDIIQKSSKQSATALDLETSRLEFMTKGYSQGQAGKLAYARASGLAAEAVERLGKVLQSQRSLIGGDPFDKSLGSMTKFQNELKVLTKMEELHGRGLGLTRSQMESLGREHVRLTEKYRIQGKAIGGLEKEYQDLVTAASGVARAENQIALAMKSKDKAMGDSARAAAFLEGEMAKVVFANQELNNSLGRGSASQLLKFEQALKKTGATAAEQKLKLEAYRLELDKLEKKSGNAKTDHISRAIAPQITDIVVGLSTGQSPLTVMLQQGGQLRDQLSMAGIAANDMGMAMRNAMSGMVTSVAAVGKAMGTMLIGGLMDAGSAVKNMAGNMLGLNVVSNSARGYFDSLGESGKKYTAVLNGIGKATSFAFGTGLVLGIGAVIALGVALAGVISEENKLTKVLALNAGTLGLTKDSAVAYAQSLSGAAGTTGQFIEAISEMAKSGKFTRDEIGLVATAAVQMSKYMDVAVEDTVKSFAKMKEEPVKNLVELGKQTGMVSLETLKSVAEFEKQGNAAQAASLAIKTLAQVNSDQVEMMKKDYNGFSLFIIELGGKIKQFFNNAFADLWRSNSTEAMGRAMEDLNKKIATEEAKSSVFKNPLGWGTFELDSLKAQKKVLQDKIDLRDKENKKVEETNRLQSEQSAIFGASQKLLKDAEKATDKADGKKLSLEEFKKKFIDDKLTDAAKEANIDKAKLEGQKDLLLVLEQQAKVEFAKLHKAKPKVDPVQRYGAAQLNSAKDAFVAAEGAVENYTKAQIKMMQIINDPKFLALKTTDQQDILSEYAAAHAVEEKNEALELQNKILGKSVGLGKDYYETLDKINKYQANGTYDSIDAEKLRDALMGATKYAKELTALTDGFRKTEHKYLKDSERDGTAQEREKQGLLLRTQLLTASVEQAKLLTAESQRQADIDKAKADFNGKLADIKWDMDLGKLDPVGAIKAADAAEKLYLNARRIADEGLFVTLSENMKQLNGSTTEVSGKFANLLRDSGQLSFANAVTSLNGMVVGFQELIDKQATFNKMREAAGTDTKKLAQVNQQAAQSQIKSYGDITGSMKGFFKEGSKGYKALNAAEKVFRAFEMAMSLKSAAVQIAQTLGITSAKVAGDATVAASATASAGVQVAAQGAVASAAAVAAIATQGTGDPYTAFPRIAAMVAIMAGLGILVGGSSGGSGVQPSNKGTGTVFGDSEAKSESIANSLSILEDVNSLTAQYSQQMAASLRNIETALVGVTNVILRSNGMEISQRGVVPGKSMGSMGSILGTGFMDSFNKKLMSALFGTKTTITGQGVVANDATIQEIQAGQLSAGYYTDVNKKKSFLGLTVSDKNSTQFDESKELSRQFGGIINGFVDVIKAAAPILGVSLSDIDKSLEGFIVKIGKIDLKDLKGDEIKEKLMAVFGAAGDDIAMQTLKGFEKYQEVGEGYLETITRVATTVEQARGQMDSLNSTMLLTVDGAMELVDAFGGLEQFLQTTSSYMNAYFTDEERKATIARQGSAALKTKGIDISAEKLSSLSYLDVRGWVKSLEEGDKELYAWAQNLAVQLSPLYELPSEASTKEPTVKEDNSAEDAAKKALDLQKQKLDLEKQLATLTGDDNALRQATLGIRALELNAMDESLRAIQLSIWAYEDQKAAVDRLVASNKALNESMARDVANAQKASDKAMAALERAVGAERKKAEEAEKAAEDIKDNLESIFELLKDSVRELFLEVDSTKKMLAAQGRDVIRGAIASGILPDEKTLGNAIGAVRDNLESTQYATKYDSDRARLGFAIELDQLKGTAGEQLSEAEKQLKAAKDQLNYLDQVLETAKAELNKLRDIEGGITSVAKAITDLTTALTTEYSTNLKQQQQYLTGTGGALYDKSTGVGTTSSGTQFTKEGLLNSFNQHIAAGGSLQQAVSVLAGSGYTLNQIEDMYGSTRGSLGAILDANGVARFAEGGAYAGGLAMVGEEGPELINFNKGGHVYTAPETQKIMGGGSNESEMRMLREEVSMLRNEARATALSTAKLNRNIERLIVPTAEGEALQTKTVA